MNIDFPPSMCQWTHYVSEKKSSSLERANLSFVMFKLWFLSMLDAYYQKEIVVNVKLFVTIVLKCKNKLVF
jgi:hypothetical protein